VTVVLYRPSLDARSGAGQLLEMQWRGLSAAGIPALIACERGALKFWLRTGVRAHRRSVRKLERLRVQGDLIVDHGLGLPAADVVFVHNLASEVQRHVPPHADSALAAQREREFFRALRGTAIVVANSRLVAAALHSHFGIARERIEVLYPGYRSQRYSPQRAAALRAGARRALGLEPQASLVGLITSGDFAKRGLDLFLDAAVQIAGARPGTQFLVVGSKDLPEYARAHALVRSGAVSYRPKGRDPEPWFAALDLFLYPARFEEYGMVVAEAQAMGVPVVTSRLVGASESLPEPYAPWIVERPEVAAMAAKALALLADVELRRGLASAAAATIAAFDDRAYVEGTRRLLAARTAASDRG
jgi:glycosyltransferase involved in cell wall biosynthesis